MMTEIFSLVCVKVAVLLVCAQAMIWLIVESPAVPTIDPYIPRAKRPPARLKLFLDWLNAQIDMMVDRIVP
jgi:hypothetical protein